MPDCWGREGMTTHHQRPLHKNKTGSGRALSPMWVSRRTRWEARGQAARRKLPESHQARHSAGSLEPEDGERSGPSTGKGQPLVGVPPEYDIRRVAVGGGVGCRAHAEDSGASSSGQCKLQGGARPPGTWGGAWEPRPDSGTRRGPRAPPHTKAI